MENTSMTSLAPHFESILDTLSDGVFISDAEGTTLFVNKMYETLTGLRQGEIRGKNIRTLVQQGTVSYTHLDVYKRQLYTFPRRR